MLKKILFFMFFAGIAPIVAPPAFAPLVTEVYKSPVEDPLHLQINFVQAPMPQQKIAPTNISITSNDWKKLTELSKKYWTGSRNKAIIQIPSCKAILDAIANKGILSICITTPDTPETIGLVLIHCNYQITWTHYPEYGPPYTTIQTTPMIECTIYSEKQLPQEIVELVKTALPSVPWSGTLRAAAWIGIPTITFIAVFAGTLLAQKQGWIK